jgi:hypothetical protein
LSPFSFARKASLGKGLRLGSQPGEVQFYFLKSWKTINSQAFLLFFRKFGRLSNDEMHLSGAKEYFGAEPRVHLSENGMRYISHSLTAILRSEKFEK